MVNKDRTPALVIMAKAPVPGIVKTRLASSLGSAVAVRLADCMLRDSVELALGWGKAVVYLSFAPAGEEAWLRAWVPEEVNLLVQAEGDLGAKMGAVVEDLGRKHQPVIIIGADIPELEPEHLDAALDALEQASVCLGPALDGGYYLIGLNVWHPVLFQGLPWGTSRVLVRTLARAKEEGLAVELLPEMADIDTEGDLLGLKARIKEGGRGANAAGRHTVRFLTASEEEKP